MAFSLKVTAPTADTGTGRIFAVLELRETPVDPTPAVTVAFSFRTDALVPDIKAAAALAARTAWAAYRAAQASSMAAASKIAALDGLVFTVQE